MYKYLYVLGFAAATTNAFAASQTSLISGPHDQVPNAIAAASVAASSTLDRAPVQISHALDSSVAVDVAPTPYLAHSREFWTEVAESELRTGVKFNTTAPGALIRLSPLGGGGAALDPAGVHIRSNGRSVSANDASSAIADTEALRSAGMDVPAGTLAFRLGAAAGSGAMQISATHAQGRYVMHVFEPASVLELRFGAERDTVFVGDTITFRAVLADSAATRSLKTASGLVTAPDGYSADLKFSRNADGSYSSTFTPDAAHSFGPQLWEAHVFAAADLGTLSVLRDAKTAFAVSAPTARLRGVEIARDAGSLSIALDVVAEDSSRYQISGVLFGTGADGQLHPSALAQSASWIEAGNGRIELRFDAGVLSANSLHAPYELRDLRLIDQATMSLNERRERALVIE